MQIDHEHGPVAREQKKRTKIINRGKSFPHHFSPTPPPEKSDTQANCLTVSLHKLFQFELLVVDEIIKYKLILRALRGDLYHLQRLTWLVERTKQRTTEQCSQP